MNRHQKIELLKARMKGSKLYPVYDQCDVLYLDNGKVSVAETDKGILEFNPPIDEKDFHEQYTSERKPAGFTTKQPPLVGVDYEAYLKQQDKPMHL